MLCASLFHWNVFAEPWLRNGLHNPVVPLLRSCMLRVLPINGRCLQSHRSAAGQNAMIWTNVGNYIYVQYRSIKIRFYLYAGPCMELRDLYWKVSLCAMFCFPPSSLVTRVNLPQLITSHTFVNIDTTYEGYSESSLSSSPDTPW
jgi:hypothetical protein